MDEEETLMFDNLQSDSNTTVGGTPLCIQPHRSWGHHKRLPLRCMCGSQRWRHSEPMGHEGHPVLISVNV